MWEDLLWFKLVEGVGGSSLLKEDGHEYTKSFLDPRLKWRENLVIL